MKIGLNPGHDRGEHTGAYNPGYCVSEGYIVYAIGELLRKELEALGHQVVFVQKDNLCGEAPYYDTADSVCGILNAADTDLNISLHCNAWEGPDNGAQGAETYYYKGNDDGQGLAAMVQNNLVRIGFVNRGIKESKWLGFLKRTDATSILVEVGFIRHPHDINILLNRQQEIAEAVAAAVKDYF